MHLFPNLRKRVPILRANLLPQWSTAMLFDVFFSICQTEVNGEIPSERTMFLNFFDQVKAADQLGYGTAWLAESHLSCEVQRLHKEPVIPNFRGEIGLNTDVLLMASKIFAETKQIHVGSAIRSLFVNGGPIAHAESVNSFLSLHSLDSSEKRKLHLGFAAGRFAFSSKPYGIVPRKLWEEKAWGAIKGKIFLEATEIFLRFLRGDIFSSQELSPQWLCEDNFRSPDEWRATLSAAQDEGAELKFSEAGHAGGVNAGGAEAAKAVGVKLPSRWNFPITGVIPKEAPHNLLQLYIGSHDPAAQLLANSILPCGVFNLSITPGAEIERTHARMQQAYHTQGQGWQRSLMPRTVLVFLNCDATKTKQQQSKAAQSQAQSALRAYWNALEGTIDETRIKNAVHNALIGNAQDVAQQLQERFHPEDRLMLWFDFFNHNNKQIINSMENFKQLVVPLLDSNFKK